MSTKTRSSSSTLRAGLLPALALAVLCLQLPKLFAQGTAFTYQGWLNDGVNPANGSYDLRFGLFDALTIGNQVGSPLTNSPVNVSNGRFSVPLDFGNQFPGVDRWLEIAVRTNGGGAFTILSPRHPLTATPYALTAGNAGTAARLATANNQPISLTVNGTTVLRIESVFDPYYGSATANSLGGSSANVISNGFVGGFIGGGGNASYPNRVGADYASVPGGLGNTASGEAATAMGRSTTASGFISTAIGQSTRASGFISTAMGLGTVASGDNSTAMGWNTTASGIASAAMGSGTAASGNYSTAVGRQAKANHTGSFVWADSQGSDFASARADQFAIRAGGGVVMTVGSSGLNPAGVFINSTSANGVALYCAQTSSDAAVVINNSGTGDLIKAFSGGSLNFEVLNDGTVYSKGVALASDRNAKEKFVPVDGREVLAKIATLPLTEWTYKTDPLGTRHIGPMAQDFHAAFGLNGSDDKHISVVDESGVALAAIQGLNEKVDVRSQRSDDRMQKLEAENADLKQELANLKGMVERLAQPRKEH